MATLAGVPSVDIFQEARDKIEQEITEMIRGLKNKQTKLFAEINKLEKEFTNKQQQQQKELTKLKNLKSQTEELGENNLLKIQQKVVRELQLEIGRLKLDTELTPDYSIDIVWGFSIKEIMRSINRSKIETKRDIKPAKVPQQIKISAASLSLSDLSDSD